MKKVSILFLVLLGMLVVAVSCAQPQQAEPENQQAEPENQQGEPEDQQGEGLRVEVGRRGFDGTAGEYRLEVEVGQEVDITFVYGDKDLSQNNPHIIAIPDLGITSGLIDQDNPEATIRFTAGDTGEFAFVCTKVDCVGHTNLLGGILVIE